MAENRNKLTLEKGSFMIPGVYSLDGRYAFTFEAPEDASVSLLFYKKNTMRPFIEFEIGDEYRLGRIRSVRVRGKNIEKYDYNFQVNGKVVQDPYAHALFGREQFGAPVPENPHQIRCGLLPVESYDWEETTCPQIPLQDMVLYKLHVRGFTKAAGSRLRKRGLLPA